MQNWILHPFWTHFPIALFGISAGMMAISGFRNQKILLQILPLQLLLALVSGIPALVTGLLDAGQKFRGESYPVWLQIHIAAAFSLLFFSGIILLILYRRVVRRGAADPFFLILFALALFAGLALLIFSGMQLVFGGESI